MFTATTNLHVDLTLTSLFQILNINGHWFDYVLKACYKNDSRMYVLI